MGRKAKVTTHNVPSSSSSNNTEVHVFEPPQTTSNGNAPTGTIITVHPWATLGGGEHNTIGLARYITTSLSTNQQQWRVITFTLQSTPLWRGGALWGILSKHSYEVRQIVDVTNWAINKFGPVVLLGSSAGAPMAGSAMYQVIDECRQIAAQDGKDPQQNIIAYIAVGYTFGTFASLGFGRHFSSVTTSPGTFTSLCGNESNSASTDQNIRIPPKLFIMGESDEFTTVDQLEQMAEKMKRNCTSGRVDVEIVPEVGHFQLESPSYDPVVSKLVVDWLNKILAQDI